MAPEGHDDEPTCGKGIAAGAVLPERLAAVMRATAELMESHLRSLDPEEPGGKAEIEAYKQLASDHLALGDRLDALAVRMRGYRDLPAATHDMDIIMDQRSTDAFVALVDREQELSDLLQERVKEHREMLDGIG